MLEELDKLCKSINIDNRHTVSDKVYQFINSCLSHHTLCHVIARDEILYAFKFKITKE